MCVKGMLTMSSKLIGAKVSVNSWISFRGFLAWFFEVNWQYYPRDFALQQILEDLPWY